MGPFQAWGCRQLHRSRALSLVLFFSLPDSLLQLWQKPVDTLACHLSPHFHICSAIFTAPHGLPQPGQAPPQGQPSSGSLKFLFFHSPGLKEPLMSLRQNAVPHSCLCPGPHRTTLVSARACLPTKL